MNKFLVSVFLCIASLNLTASQVLPMRPHPVKTETPYGSWKSPLSADLIVSDAVRIECPETLNGSVIFSETRPSERGRCALVQFKDGKLIDLLPNEYNVRTTVHEYGGKSYFVDGDVLYFSNYSDQQLYKRDQKGEISQLTHESSSRFVDGRAFKDLLIFVMEKHGDEVENSLVVIDRQGHVKRIAEGWDFYREPRISPVERS